MKHLYAGDSVEGSIVVSEERGLSTTPARYLTHRARSFECAATIENTRGKIADAQDLLQLLLLGLAAGERATVRCRGPDAWAVYRVIVDFLEGRTEFV
jgi:phosphotransferase system HPr (HPr) family protein